MSGWADVAARLLEVAKFDPQRRADWLRWRARQKDKAAARAARRGKTERAATLEADAASFRERADKLAAPPNDGPRQ